MKAVQQFQIQHHQKKKNKTCADILFVLKLEADTNLANIIPRFRKLINTISLRKVKTKNLL